MKYEDHPIAAMFPMMSDEQYEAFKQDIAENGLRSSGLLYEGKILDGRNRSRACDELGLQMEWQDVSLSEDADSFDPIAYVISHNLHRRHLTTAQRSMVAAKLATLKNGSNQHKATGEGSSNDEPSKRDEAAKLLNVSTASVDRAKHVIAKGSKDVAKAVECGELNLNQATKLVKAVPDKREQTKIVREGKDAVKAATASASQKPVTKNDAPGLSDCEDVDDSEMDSHASYSKPVIALFKKCDHRLGTIRHLLMIECSSVEREIVKDWLSCS